MSFDGVVGSEDPKGRQVGKNKKNKWKSPSEKSGSAEQTREIEVRRNWNFKRECVHLRMGEILTEAVRRAHERWNFKKEKIMHRKKRNCTEPLGWEGVSFNRRKDASFSEFKGGI